MKRVVKIRIGRFISDFIFSSKLKDITYQGVFFLTGSIAVLAIIFQLPPR
jgi:hypothetical protein